MTSMGFYVNGITACKLFWPPVARKECILRLFIFPGRILEHRSSLQRVWDQSVELRWRCRCLVALEYTLLGFLRRRIRSAVTID